jgi:hypothetical protein
MMKPNKSKSRADFLGIATLLLTIVFGSWGVYLSREQAELSKAQIALSIKQDSTALDLIHFSELLKKTDSVIILSTDQLKINQEEQKRASTIYENTQIGNMNRLLETAHRIGTEHLMLINANLGVSENSLREYSSRLERLKILLVSEMDNPYLNSNDTINELWSLTYANVGQLNQQIEFSLMNVGKRVVNLNKGAVEIGEVDTANVKIVIRQLAGEIFTSVGATTGYIFSKVKRDKIRLGLLDKNGKSKINPLNFYK